MSGHIKRFAIRDAQGVLVAVHARRDTANGKKVMWWEQPDGKSGLHGLPTGELPLYGSDEVANWPEDALIIVTEGEKPRDALKRKGFHALATVTGAGNCPCREVLSILWGRTVVLWPDADAHGRKHMVPLAGLLEGIAGDVRVFEWPEAQPGDDAVEYLAAGPDRADMLRQALLSAGSATEWIRGLSVPSDAAAAEASSVASDGEPPAAAPRASSVATRIAALADAAELFHTPAQEAFASVEIGGHRENLRIGSSRFRSWLRQQWFRANRVAAPTEAITAAADLLAARAAFEGPEIEVFTRIAPHSNRVYIDLASPTWEVIEVTPHSWSIVPQAPVKFWRPRGMAALPAPERGGDIELLRPFVNVGSTEDWILLVSWIAACLRPHGPFPVLALHGEQGSAKSTTATLVRSLIDPNEAPLRSEPTCARDLMISASNSLVQAFDNLSHLAPWLSDGLCRLATGGAFATRELYSDAEEVMFQAERPVLLNGIVEVATRSDLLDRAIVLTLPRISEERRRPEAEFWQDFERVKPAILGALLDALSIALRVSPGIRLKHSPRMADFATWSAATSLGFKWGPGAFARAYGGNRETSHEVALESSPAAQAVLSLVKAKGLWEGTATELLDRLEHNPSEAERRRSGWPRSARALSSELRRLAPNLRGSGIEVNFGRHHGGRRVIALWPLEDARVASVTNVTSVSATEFLETEADEIWGKPVVASSPTGAFRHPAPDSVTGVGAEAFVDAHAVTQVTQGTESSGDGPAAAAR